MSAVLCADAVVVCRGSVLFVKRQDGMLALPGGGIDYWRESCQRAAIRETYEEAGVDLTNVPCQELKTRHAPGRDARGRYVSVPYLFWLQEYQTPMAASDAVDAFWSNGKEVDLLAFDHEEILNEALHEVGSKTKELDTSTRMNIEDNLFTARHAIYRIYHQLEMCFDKDDPRAKKVLDGIRCKVHVPTTVEDLTK